MRYLVEQARDRLLRKCEELPGGGEIVPWIVYDTEVFYAHKTEHLDFFQRPGRYPKTNMYLPAMLPAPQEFLIESIRLTGLPSALLASAAVLQIGAKIYGVYPAVSLCLKGRGFHLDPPLLIDELRVFRFGMEWEAQTGIGLGVQGVPIYEKRVQVELIGKLVRPRQ